MENKLKDKQAPRARINEMGSEARIMVKYTKRKGNETPKRWRISQ